MQPRARHDARRWLARLVGLAAALAVVVALQRWLGFSWDAESLRAQVDRLGVWGPLAFVGMVTFRQLLLMPHQLLLVAGGLALGGPLATACGAAGLWISGLAIFALIRWLGADGLRARVPPGLARWLERAGTRGAAGILALFTAYPVGNITTGHVAGGLSPMPLRWFAGATALGSPVRAGIFAFFGGALAEGDWRLAAALAIATGLILAPLLHPRVRAWAGAQFRVGGEEASAVE